MIDNKKDNQIEQKDLVKTPKEHNDDNTVGVFDNISLDEDISRRAMKKKYIITACIAVLLFFALAIIMGLFKGYDPTVHIGDKSSVAFIFRKLSDIFFVDGVIFLTITGFTFCSRAGAYDGLVFGVRQAIGVMFKRPEDMKYKDLNDYKEAQAKKDKAPYKHLLLIGLMFLFVGIIFLVIYYSINK